MIFSKESYVVHADCNLPDPLCPARAGGCSSHRLYDRSGLRSGDFGPFENSEAFTLSSVLFHCQLGAPYEQLIVHGGAIVLGHPIGCRVARIPATLLHALRRHGARRGHAALCHGTGGGTALAIECR